MNERSFAEDLRALVTLSQEESRRQARQQADDFVGKIVIGARNAAIDKAKLGYTNTSYTCTPPSVIGQFVSVASMMDEIVEILEEDGLKVKASLFDPDSYYRESRLNIAMDWSES